MIIFEPFLDHFGDILVPKAPPPERENQKNSPHAFHCTARGGYWNIAELYAMQLQSAKASFRQPQI